MVRYQCSKPSDILQNQGKNCAAYAEPKAVGRCYKNTFGDWICGMSDISGSTSQHGVPPPQVLE
jgi:hypothetical protein